MLINYWNFYSIKWSYPLEHKLCKKIDIDVVSCIVIKPLLCLVLYTVRDLLLLLIDCLPTDFTTSTGC